MFRFSSLMPVSSRVWALGKDLFAGRCWGPDDLLGQVIRLDHQVAVRRHFYPAAQVSGLVEDFGAFEVALNLETAAFFRELLEACGEAPSDEAPALHRALADLGRRESQTSRRTPETSSIDLIVPL